MIINRNTASNTTLKVQPIVRKEGTNQENSSREIQKEAIEQKSNNSYIADDIFIQQLRTLTDINLLAMPSTEASRADSNRVRTGLEAKAEEENKEEVFTQVFEREQNTVAEKNAPRKDLELPPMETLTIGREKPTIEPTQLDTENEETFVAFEEYTPPPTVEQELGFYRYEMELAKLDSRERMVMREPLEPTPPPAFRQAFSQPQDEDFSYLPPPKHETLNAPLPAPLRLPKTQSDFLNQQTIRIETDGAQPPQESARQTLRTYDNTVKSPIIIPQTLAAHHQESILPAPIGKETQSEPTEPPAPRIPPSLAQSNVEREAPVIEIAKPNRPLDSFEQTQQLLTGTQQIIEEDIQVTMQAT